MKTYLSWTNPPLKALMMGLALFCCSLSLQPAHGTLREGEGTGHQRVVQLVGRSVPPQKVYFNERFNPSFTKLAAVNMMDVSVIILQNEDVIPNNQIQKMNFNRGTRYFGDLQSVIHQNEVIEKDEIWAVVVK